MKCENKNLTKFFSLRPELGREGLSSDSISLTRDETIFFINKFFPEEEFTMNVRCHSDVSHII